MWCIIKDESINNNNNKKKKTEKRTSRSRKNNHIKFAFYALCQDSKYLGFKVLNSNLLLRATEIWDNDLFSNLTVLPSYFQYYTNMH